ncbi:hypothetical protein QJS10_CPB19g01084 [Acorus calamus]|uniref:Uncharacterized protein n=1 Tax=Acorus calamus TaxID=4465 RepID=A0AAV9CEA8_ACOCL|nr:hypothetical protein QJS10_CPB19g01084 [Acorus calamus]
MILTERATATMEEIPNSAPNEALIKAEAPKLVSLLEEMKNGLDVLTQEPRFLREEETMLVPPWLELRLSSTFFTICRVHDDLT